MKKQSNLLLASAVAAVLLPQAYAYAQGGALEEIIVTAERRATTENTTAISMNVLSAEDLASTQTKNIADLQASTPNVTINNPGGFNSINIRGIGNSAIQPSIQVGVAVLQDGLLNAETITLGNQFLDLGTVEVLRGPQGTFIGTSSTGGAIRLNSVKPSLTDGTKGFVEGVIGTYSDAKVTGAVNLPISDTWAARLAFGTEHRNSYFQSAGTVTGPVPTQGWNRQGSVNDQNARISLLWAPNDNLEAIWRTEWNRSDNEGSPVQPNPRTFTAANGQQVHSRYWNNDAPADPNHDPSVLSINSRESQFLGTIERHSLEVNYKFDNDITFRSQTGFQHSENAYNEDGDGSFANASMVRNDVGPDNNYYSQEFNLISPEGPLNWVVGASWFYRHTPVNQIAETYTCGINPVNGVFTACPTEFFMNIGPGVTGPTLPNITVTNALTTVRTGGVFGQVNWKFTDTLELTAGLRYNVDRNYSTGRYNGSGTRRILIGTAALPAGGNVPAGATLNGAAAFRGNCTADITAVPRYSGLIDYSQSTCIDIGGRPPAWKDETPTWKVGLNWNPDDNNFLYVFYARGYKSGGSQTAQPFVGEQVDDYEAGWKGTFMDGRANLSLGAFYNDYQDIQQQVFLATTNNAGNAVVNVGKATIQGVEAEFNMKLAGFGIQANAGWVDSELGSISAIDRTLVPDALVRAGGAGADLVQCAAGVTPVIVGGVLAAGSTCADYSPYYIGVSGLTNIYSPELSWGITLDYEFLVGDATLTPRVSFSHTDAQDVNLIRREEFWQIPKRELTNASVTYAKGDWTAQAFVNNVTDKTYIAAIGTGGGLDNNSVVYGAPRTIGIRVRKAF
ncbi:MAG: TonB-dependent receptor [Steroidobacteraceae bacterium]